MGVPRDRLIEALSEALPGAVQEAAGRAAFLPRSEAELADALRIATRIGAPMCAPGAEPRDGAVPIDLRRMNDLLAFDDESNLVHVEAGATLREVEAALGERNLTLAMTNATEVAVGAWLSKGAEGARDLGADPVDQLVAGLSAVLPDGRLLHIRPAPRRAVGPDLIGAFIGGRGRLGIISSAHLVARPRTAETIAAFRFDAPDAAASALAWMRGVGVRPVGSEIRVGDGDGAVLAIRLDGPDRVRDVRTAVARRVAEERGGVSIDEPRAPVGARALSPSPATVALADAIDAEGVLGRSS
jgi:FAD/FMN-containing dehydrogenase